MKYEIGDKIVVNQTDEDGIVVDIINEKMVMIEVRGVKFPAYTDQIDFPYFKMFTQKKVVEKKKIYVDDIKREKTKPKSKTSDGVFLRLLPVYDKDVFDDDVVDKLKVFLINENEEAYTFKYQLFFGTENSFLLNNSINGLSEFYLHDIDFEDVSDNPKFEFEFSLEVPNKKKALYYECGLKTTGKKLFKRIEELQKKQEASFGFLLFTQYPDKLVDLPVDVSGLNNAGFRVYDAGKLRDYLPAYQSVIDLHIEKLTDQPKSLENHEIFDLQIKTFEKYYDLAIAHKQPTLIVVHGVGEGFLRNEIHEILRLKKEVKSFVNQYHHLYGYGATEIFFN